MSLFKCVSSAAMQLLLLIFGFYYWMAGATDARANAACATLREKHGSKHPEEASLWLDQDQILMGSVVMDRIDRLIASSCRQELVNVDLFCV